MQASGVAQDFESEFAEANGAAAVGRGEGGAAAVIAPLVALPAIPVGRGEGGAAAVIEPMIARLEKAETTLGKMFTNVAIATREIIETKQIREKATAAAVAASDELEQAKKQSRLGSDKSTPVDVDAPNVLSLAGLGDVETKNKAYLEAIEAREQAALAVTKAEIAFDQAMTARFAAQTELDRAALAFYDDRKRKRDGQ